MKEGIKSFFIDCMLFQNPWMNYGFMPNWAFGIFAWINMFIIFYPLVKLLL